MKRRQIFIVCYDLRNERDYESLYARLKELGGKRVLESTWTLKFYDDLTCEDIRNDLNEYMDSDDGIFVAEIISAAWANIDCNAPHRF